MERLAMANAHQKTEDPQREYYMKQKKNLEINPRHPIVKDLLRRVKDDPQDAKAKEIALMMFRTGKYSICISLSLRTNSTRFSLHARLIFSDLKVWLYGSRFARIRASR